MIFFYLDHGEINTIDLSSLFNENNDQKNKDHKDEDTRDLESSNNIDEGINNQVIHDNIEEDIQNIENADEDTDNQVIHYNIEEDIRNIENADEGTNNQVIHYNIEEDIQNIENSGVIEETDRDQEREFNLEQNVLNHTFWPEEPDPKGLKIFATDNVAKQNVSAFAKEFYRILLLTREKFPKMYIKKIDFLLSKYWNLPKMSREEYRSIQLYFENRLRQKDKILYNLQEHKNEISKSGIFDGYKYKKFLKKS